MKILVIVSDTFRADNLKVHQSREARTPALSQLADQGTVFTNCYTGSFPTTPNRQDLFMGLFTALNPQNWGMRYAQGKNLAQMFKEAGHLTQIISDTTTMMGSFFDVLRKSFHGCSWIRGQGADMPVTKFNYLDEISLPREKIRYVGGRLGKKLPEINAITNRHWAWEEDRFCVQVAREASRWLEENYLARNFLLWVDLFDPHEPWTPPEYLIEHYQGRYEGVPMIHPNYGRADRYSRDELENLRAHYLGEVELVDKWIGHILRKLEDVGISDETVVIFTSDHGHLIGEHNWAGKSNYDGWWLRNKNVGWDKRAMPLYRELAHIPLIIKAPNLSGSKSREELVQPVDLLPTLLDLAGLDIPSYLHGHSLSPLLMGELIDWPRRFAVSTGMGSHGIIQPYLGRHASLRESIESNVQGPTIRDHDWTLFLHGEEYVPELYKRQDSMEKDNIISENHSQALEIGKEFLVWLKKIEADRRFIDWTKKKISLI